MSRFYTNPFVRDAEPVAQVSASEPRFSGYSVTTSGVTADYVRTVRYSDGTERQELVARRKLEPYEVFIRALPPQP